MVEVGTGYLVGDCEYREAEYGIDIQISYGVGWGGGYLARA